MSLVITQSQVSHTRCDHGECESVRGQEPDEWESICVRANGKHGDACFDLCPYHAKAYLCSLQYNVRQDLGFTFDGAIL